MITYLMREDGDIICSQMYVEMFCRELCNYLNFNERIYKYDFDVIVYLHCYDKKPFIKNTTDSTLSGIICYAKFIL